MQSKLIKGLKINILVLKVTQLIYWGIFFKQLMGVCKGLYKYYIIDN